MRANLWTLLTLVLLAPAAPAHFLFLLPGTDKQGKPTVSLVFSDALAPDENADLLDRVKQAEAFICGPQGKSQRIKLARADKFIAVELTGDGPRAVGVTCQYGVLKRGEGDPFLLVYSARTAIGQKPAVRVDDRPMSEMGLDVVLNQAAGSAQVLWQGKPLAGAEVVLTVPGVEENSTLSTDRDGKVKLEKAKKAGLYGIRARHTLKKGGKLDDKEYTEIRLYATCVFEATAEGKTE